MQYDPMIVTFVHCRELLLTARITQFQLLRVARKSQMARDHGQQGPDVGNCFRSTSDGRSWSTTRRDDAVHGGLPSAVQRRRLIL